MRANNAENPGMSSRSRPAALLVLTTLLLGAGAAAGVATSADGAEATDVGGMERETGDAAAGGSSGPRHGRSVHHAGARSDTLDHPWREVLPVAIDQLKKDDWQIQRADTAAGRIVSRWKPLKHLLARLFLGGVMARVVVDVTPLGPSRTAVTIRGGLASDDDLEANPGFHTAQSAYMGAAKRWLERVRRALDEHPPDQAKALATPSDPVPSLNPR